MEILLLLSYPATAPPMYLTLMTEEFYAELSELTKAVPKHNVLLIGADMNGKIGASDAKGQSTTNTPTRMGNCS